MGTQQNMRQEFKTVKDIDTFIEQIGKFGMKLSDEQSAALSSRRKELEAAEKSDSETPLYSAMKAQSKFPITEEFDSCVRRTVDKLLADGSDSDHPGLLLGNIQCGKTNTFENIIALAFDKGIEVCVIFTKGTKTLASQTLARAKADFAFARKTDVIDDRMKVVITDIMNLRHRGVSTIDTNDDHCRQIIICKKETKNLESLINLYENISSNLRTERTLIVDDEADFASRVYRGSGLNTDLAKISEQIDYFRKLPKDCRYLQVTATPYSLYLQPDGTILKPDGGKALPFRPHFTELVPTHSRYIGGKQYFEESKEENSMYSHLFVPVSGECLEALTKKNKKIKATSFHSVKKLKGLSNAICGYIMATAIRSLQREREGKLYSSSCLIHIQVSKSGHEWERELVEKMIEDIRKVILDKNGFDIWLDQIMEASYDDFKASIKKGRAAGLLGENAIVPEYDEVVAKMRALMENDLQVCVVNSDNEVNSLLDENGQLELSRAVNIFVGGSILDRGITVGNMLCFFYGRNPRKIQMDTALQHARMYGARSLEDMSVTRFYTTEAIHYALGRIYELDSMLRDQFTTRDSNGEIAPSDAVIIGYETGISPCSKSKIKFSDTKVVKAHTRLLPVGFQIGEKEEVAPIVNEIDELIKSRPGFVRGKEFLLDSEDAKKILDLIEKTYRYGEKYKNSWLRWESQVMKAVIERSLADVEDGKLWCIYRDGRQISRKNKQDDKYVDNPEAGNTEAAPARRLATDRPVLTLLREEGAAKQGWSGTPFYWPILIAPSTFTAGIFAHAAPKVMEESDIDDAEIKELTKNIPPKDILRLNIKQMFLEDIYLGIKKSEYRLLEPQTAGRYIEMNSRGGEPKLAEGVKRKDIDAGLFSLNNGEFPFIMKDFKYLLLYVPFKKDYQLLVRLKEGDERVSAVATKMEDWDLIHDEFGDSEEVEIDNEFCWTLKFRIAEVLGPKRPDLDKWRREHPEEFEELRRMEEVRESEEEEAANQ